MREINLRLSARRWLSRRAICQLLAFVLLFFGYYGFRVFGPSAHSVVVNASVIDSETGLPLGNIDVFIYVWDYGVFDSHSYAYLVRTDLNGEIHFEKRVPFAIKRIWLLAWNDNMTEHASYESDTYVGSLIERSTNRECSERLHFYPDGRNITLEMRTLKASQIAISRLHREAALDRVKFTNWREANIR